jgi:hypothetical protein
VRVLTVRSGTHTVRVVAADAVAGRGLVQAECDYGQHHCPPDWCSDDVESTVLDVRQVGPGGVLDRAGG